MVKRWFEAQARLQKKHNITLDPLARQCGQLTWEERQMENFDPWRDRVEILKQAFDEHEPASVLQWWSDGRRNWTHWYTFWVVIVLFGLTILLSLLQLVLVVFQVYLAYRLRPFAFSYSSIFCITSIVAFKGMR